MSMTAEQQNMVELFRLTGEQFDDLLQSGQLSVKFPQTMGLYGITQVDVDSLSNLLVGSNLTGEEKRAIFDEFKMKAIMNEGFTEEQASEISWMAYEDGHYAGVMEEIQYIEKYITFAKAILKKQ